jgi:hypothetical protein
MTPRYMSWSVSDIALEAKNSAVDSAMAKTTRKVRSFLSRMLVSMNLSMIAMSRAILGS